MDSNIILLDKADGLTITFNRPEAMDTSNWRSVRDFKRIQIEGIRPSWINAAPVLRANSL